MTDGKRQTLKQKVEAGQARNKAKTENTTTVFDRAGEAALEAKDRFTAFAKEHPIATVAGGLAVGILIAGLFKGPRRAAVKGGSKAAGLAAIGAELALAYAQQAMEAASEAGKASADRLDGIGDAARSAGKAAADRAGDARDAALAMTSAAGRRLGKAIRSRIN
jgi:ElaB/YqjD/DUF883 family membrane-anchored ribosome-binding protein